MTDTAGALGDIAPFDALVLLRGNSRRVVPGAIAIGVGTVAAAWAIAAVLSAHPGLQEKARPHIQKAPPKLQEPPPKIEMAPVAAKPVVVANPFGALTANAYSFESASLLYGPGLAPHPAPAAAVAPRPPAAAVAAPAPSVAPPPAKPAPEPAKTAPLPPEHPVFRPSVQANREIVRSEVRSTGPQIAAPPKPAVAAPAPDNRNIFQKFFDAIKQPAGPAQPEDGAIGAPGVAVSLPAPNSGVAVYDIAAHTVYMPNGDRLEAHSGLGPSIDDPRRVNERGRGATPPHVYDLALRGQLFHGVAALRLNPVGGGTMYNRTGLLAHTYMLGPRGDSNGCVSFRDYRRFLQAYSSGQVKRLVVVAHLGAALPAAPARRITGHRYASN